MGKLSTGKTARIPLYHFWQPRYWPALTGIFILRVIATLPYSVLTRLGRMVGRMAHRMMSKRRHIAAVNLALCFPELTHDELRRLVIQHFESLGISIFELAISIWGSDSRVRKLVTIDGFDNLFDALRKGKGVIVMSGHFTGIEMVARAVKQSVPNSGAMYRPVRNPLIDELLRRGRAHDGALLIPKDGLRELVRALKQGCAIWYAADQAYDRKGSALVPFFGVPAMTNAALTTIGRLSNATVVPLFTFRKPDGTGLYAEILPALPDYPSGDPEQDAALMNRLLEEKIRLAPAEYYWIHRRFKNRPAPLPDPYEETG
jgi:KDO2-lipid IV(A) lauroyltransferase